MTKIKDILTTRSRAIAIGGIVLAVIFMIVDWMPMMYISFIVALLGLVFYARQRKQTKDK